MFLKIIAYLQIYPTWGHPWSFPSLGRFTPVGNGPLRGGVPVHALGTVTVSSSAGYSSAE